MIRQHLFSGLRLTLVTLTLFGLIYPVTITAIAWLSGPDRGEGKMVTENGRVVGFAVIGQAFHEDRYFHGRPSSVDYDAASAGASNLSPTNPAWIAFVAAQLDTFKIHNPSSGTMKVPVDLVTESGSGLDPDLSPEAAMIQIPRIAAARNLPAKRLAALVQQHTEGPLLGLLGPKKVNVLMLNIDLDRLQGHEQSKNTSITGAE